MKVLRKKRTRKTPRDGLRPVDSTEFTLEERLEYYATYYPESFAAIVRDANRDEC